MPGSRPKNLRVRDLAEGLGLELLRCFTLVAPVPRTEDVGVDAVATLIRPEAGSKLIAEDSFLVQVKTVKTRSIHFDVDGLNWLRGLRLPYFILSVDVPNATLEMYSIALASCHPNYRDWAELTVHLDPGFPPNSLSDERRDAWVGAPILSWKFSETVDESFHAMAYKVLKKWTALEIESLSLRTINYSRKITWETNKEPTPAKDCIVIFGPDDTRPVLEQMSPLVQRLLAFAMDPRYSCNELILGLTLLCRFMRDHGVDPIPEKALLNLALLHARRSEIERDDANIK